MSEDDNPLWKQGAYGDKAIHQSAGPHVRAFLEKWNATPGAHRRNYISQLWQAFEKDKQDVDDRAEEAQQEAAEQIAEERAERGED